MTRYEKRQRRNSADITTAEDKNAHIPVLSKKVNRKCLLLKARSIVFRLHNIVLEIGLVGGRLVASRDSVINEAEAILRVTAESMWSRKL